MFCITRRGLLAAAATAAMALAAAAHAQATPHPPRDEVVAAMRAHIGAEPLAALAATVHRPPQESLPPWTEPPAELRAAWYEFLLGALWSADQDVAYAAACLVPERTLDLADVDRWLAVVRPHVFDEHARWDWDTLRHDAGRADVAWILTAPPSWRADIRHMFVTDLHRSMRPEHMPLLAALQRHDDPFVRRQALETLAWLTHWTNQHREAVARAILEWRGPASFEVDDADSKSKNPLPPPREYTLPTARAGWSPLLRATLQHWFLELEHRQNEADFGPFLVRWADDEQPAREDLLLLHALLDAGGADAVTIALRAQRRFAGDPYTLRMLAEPRDDWPRDLVLAARGEREALRVLARTDVDALATALEVDFDAVWPEWLAQAFGRDAEQGAAAIERLDAACAQAACRAYRMPAPLHERLRDAVRLFGEGLDWQRLHLLVTAFPAARSERLLALYFAALRPEHLAACAAAALEVTTGIDFAGKLREWARVCDGEPRRRAFELLLRLGDTGLDGELVEYWQQAEAGSEGEARDLHLLARCGNAPAVRAWLDELLRASRLPSGKLQQDDVTPLTAAAIAHGLPAAAAAQWRQWLIDRDADLVRARFGTWRDQVLAGDPVAALADWAQATPLLGLEPRSLGHVRDERITAILQQVRRTPGGAVQQAIDELALAGDFAARRELDEVRQRGLYGWLDNASPEVWTEGRELDLVPWLIGEFETNCCHRNGAWSALEQLCEFEAIGEDALRTQREAADEWWREVADHLRWSEIAQRFVVAPH